MSEEAKRLESEDQDSNSSYNPKLDGDDAISISSSSLEELRENKKTPSKSRGRKKKTKSSKPSSSPTRRNQNNNTTVVVSTKQMTAEEVDESELLSVAQLSKEFGTDFDFSELEHTYLSGVKNLCKGLSYNSPTMSIEKKMIS